MKTPTNFSGRELAKALSKFGYTLTRQRGSHLRYTTHCNGEHHVTVPTHNPIKVGTLHSILNDLAGHHRMSVGQVLRELGL